MTTTEKSAFSQRFRGYFPVVIDIETAGFNAQTDAMLEIAASILEMDEDGYLKISHTLHFNVEPFEGANLEQAALDFTGIDPTNPLRGAVPERDAITEIYKAVRKGLKETGCHRAIMVAHNAAFDHGFLSAASSREKIKRNPFHPFATFDTTTLAGLAVGQTVLAKACMAAGIPFDHKQAHSAKYDTEQTAKLFCYIVNKWKDMGGWPLVVPEDQVKEETEAVSDSMLSTDIETE